MKLSKMFVTGCDSKTRWMVPWFLDNYHKHNPEVKIKVVDFQDGMGWLEKPAAMRRAALEADKVCWIDTDCEVLGDISGIFDYTVPGKLTMAEDKPWTTRRGGVWHNSGIVAFEGAPGILIEWEIICATQGGVGDQEVLHEMIPNPIKRLQLIENLPNKYNVLRLQHDDKTVPPNPLIYHWTGPKGKTHIRKLMK
jgi:hypothetical protein|tara:strand:+ start:1893 stop:2477 length:585 start_codon:yes stop_codon:yes gene_type:complete